MVSSYAGAVDQEVGQLNEMKFTLAIVRSAFNRQGEMQN